MGIKIRIKLKGYDHRQVDRSAAEIIMRAKNTGAKVAGPIPLPTKRELFTVLRSPHVDKRSMEHFERRIHKRLIEIKEFNDDTIDELQKLELPSGVDVEIKTLED